MPLKKAPAKKKTASKKPVKPAKKAVAKKVVKKPVKKSESKSAPKAVPVFKDKHLVLWNGPEMPERLPRGFATMNNLDLRYTATLMKQLAADIELMIEARTLADRSYEQTVSDGAEMKLGDILATLKDLKVI